MAAGQPGGHLEALRARLLAPPPLQLRASYGNNSTVSAFWADLYAARADLVLNGHEHHYERFGPQTPNAVGDPRGIREFVVGTGGARPYPFGLVKANSQKRITGQYGVLHLTLRPTSYKWKFVAVDGRVLDRAVPFPATDSARGLDYALGKRLTTVVSQTLVYATRCAGGGLTGRVVATGARLGLHLALSDPVHDCPPRGTRLSLATVGRVNWRGRYLVLAIVTIE